MIFFDEVKQVFRLENEKISYLMPLVAGRYLTHLYFGKRIFYEGELQYPLLVRSFSPYPEDLPATISLDTLPLEYPGNGFGDYRTPAHEISYEDGTNLTDFQYDHHEIISGKPKLSGLPHSFAPKEKCETLKIYLKDITNQMKVILHYTIFKDSATIARCAYLINEGDEEVVLKKAASMSLDFSPRDLEMIHLPGSWGNERQIVREKVTLGSKHLGSTRGASSHQENPFVALVTPETTENFGEAYGFSFVYSGNHETVIEKDQFYQTRVIMGIHPTGFSWPLHPGESFQTPEVLLTYAENGLNNLSQLQHEFIQKHLIRSKFKDKERPILINNWEATYFDFAEEKLLTIAKSAKEIGVELFVLDDGWFGQRNSANSSLGDWFVNEEKLPQGIKGIADKIHALGLEFGLWFEPEMISKNSKLYEEHPDWVLQAPHRKKSLGRGQYVLDFSKRAVQENLFKQMADILEAGKVNYVKWDFNRHLTEVYSQGLESKQQGTIFHRYMLGLYAFLEKLVTAFPDVLFESCSGGGGRFDCGLLYYMPQIWTSDNTDAVSRLKIQYGTSLAYPISTMGAHVSAVPNHQVGRVTPLKMRQEVAASGLLGYELDLNTLSQEELEYLKESITCYKKRRKLIQYGTFYRLMSPFTGEKTAWEFVAKDGSEVLVCFYQVLVNTQEAVTSLRLLGLEEDSLYEWEGKRYSGSELMNVGLFLPPNFDDFSSQVFYFKKLTK